MEKKENIGIRLLPFITENELITCTIYMPQRSVQINICYVMGPGLLTRIDSPATIGAKGDGALPDVGLDHGQSVLRDKLGARAGNPWRTLTDVWNKSHITQSFMLTVQVTTPKHQNQNSLRVNRRLLRCCAVYYSSISFKQNREN